MRPRITAHTTITVTTGAVPMPHTGLPASANAAITPKTGRNVAARWPIVPATDAAVIRPASGLASRSSRAMTAEVDAPAATAPSCGAETPGSSDGAAESS